MFSSSVALGAPLVRRYLPYFKRMEMLRKRNLNRQLPFLEVSKHPSLPKPLPDPRGQNHKMAKVDLAKEMNIEEGDLVQVLYGSEQGKQGIVRRIIRTKNQVVLTGLNLKRSFWQPDPAPGKPSIVSIEAPIHITNVAPIDPVIKKPTRIKKRYMMNGECVRISKVSGCAMPEPLEQKHHVNDDLWRRHQAMLARPKDRRGPPPESTYKDKAHFQMLVKILRTVTGRRSPD
eukprot:gnl/MRDRNA2_/MRDRNA2_104676_c0_seq1.p1 gnl/MRDRNA2_/MRDRNA2_104676_c0~~gnl/MRDRNA2_/MRDRNA2_104676_c0_seq1.p1  ORF type:complete len:231 (-),score=33.81 gnl/MRDRNA2_/MRDRNA2_104676_c0_seq1:64-756(-)